MAERIRQSEPTNNERDRNDLEAIREASLEHGRERYEQSSPEREQSRERESTEAERRAEQLAKSREKETATHEREESQPERRAHGPGSKKEQDAAFADTMRTTRSQMSPGGRAFSKVIHNKAVEATSEAAGKTIARPNAILAGSFLASVLVLAVYLLARYYGYPLSGSETMVVFAAGWLLGIVYDYIKAMVTGGR